MQRRKVLLVTKDFPPVYCGIGDYTEQLMRRLEVKGYEVECFTTYHSERDNDPSITTYHGQWNINAAIAMWKLTKKAPTVVLFQYVPYNFSKLGMPVYLVLFYVLCAFSRTPIITFFHEYAIRWNWSSPKEFVLAIVQRFIGTSLLLMSRAVATSSQYYKSLFLFQARMSVVPISSNFEGLQKEPASNQQENSLRLFSFANRVDPWILDAVHEVSKRATIPIQWVICGRDKKTRQKSLLQEIRDRKMEEFAFYKGEQTADQFSYWLNCSDIFLQHEYVSENGEGGVSSKNTTVAAAMQAGLAILTTCGDMTDLTLYKHEENILFFKSGDRNDLNKKLMQVIGSTKLLTSLKTAAIASYSASFSWENTVDWYVQKIQLCSVK